MNIKLLFSFIIILVIGGISGFVIGKASKNIETVEYLSILLKQFQDEIQTLQKQFTALKQELARKTGIIIKNSPTHLDTTLAKADELIKQGHLEKATLYFSHALSQSPGDWNAITYYQQTILKYCQQLHQPTIISNLVEQTRTLIQKAQSEPPNSPLILYYLTLADSLINQLVLSAPDTKEMKIQIAQFSEELDSVKENLAKTQSQIIGDEIEKTATEQLKIAKETKAQDAIVKLTQLRQSFAEKASGLTSLEFLEKAKALREKIETTLAEWQNQQFHSYNVWAAVTQAIWWVHSYKQD